MTQTEAPLAIKAATAAQYGGPTVAVYFGLTAGEWQAIGVLGGIVIGLAGLVVTWAYKHAHYKLARDGAIKAGLTE
jgi:hypothetical protein